MFKQEISYTDYNGNKRTEEHWFHLSKAEIIKLEMEHEEGFGEYVKKIASSGVKKDIYDLFVSLIKMAYGVKSPDGKKFVKNEQVYEEFAQSPAYDELLIKLFSDADLLSKMFTKMFPADVADYIEKHQGENVAVVNSLAENA